MKWRWKPGRTVGHVTLIVFFYLTALAIAIMSCVGFAIMYGFLGLLFAVILSPIAIILYPFLWWGHFHVFDWIYTIVFVTCLGTGIGAAFLGER